MQVEKSVVQANFKEFVLDLGLAFDYFMFP